MMVKLYASFGIAASPRNMLALPTLIEEYGPDRVQISFEGCGASSRVDVNISFSMLEQAFEEASRKGQAFVDLTPSGLSALKSKYGFNPDF